jgi:Tfp pilus assembly protein PilN
VSRVNLLPAELRERAALRRRTAGVALAGVAALVLLGVFYFLQLTSLSGAQSDLEQAQAANASLSQRIAELQPYAQLQQQLEAKKQLKDSLYVDEVSWSGVLLDVSRVIPDSAYLSNLSGTLTSATTAATGTPSTPTTNLIGSLNFSGVAEGTNTIAGWLTRLEQVKGWVNPWINSATENGDKTGVYQFDGGLDLTVDAVTARGRGVTP